MVPKSAQNYYDARSGENFEYAGGFCQACSVLEEQPVLFQETANSIGPASLPVGRVGVTDDPQRLVHEERVTCAFVKDQNFVGPSCSDILTTVRFCFVSNDTPHRWTCGVRPKFYGRSREARCLR